MEPCPELGKVILQRFGNSSHYFEINGTELGYGKTDLSQGIYVVTSNSAENLQNYKLNLSSAASGYVLGLFDSPHNKWVSILATSLQKCTVGQIYYTWTSSPLWTDLI